MQLVRGILGGNFDAADCTTTKHLIFQLLWYKTENYPEPSRIISWIFFSRLLQYPPYPSSMDTCPPSTPAASSVHQNNDGAPSHEPSRLLSTPLCSQKVLFSSDRRHSVHDSRSASSGIACWVLVDWRGHWAAHVRVSIIEHGLRGSVPKIPLSRCPEAVLGREWHAVYFLAYVREWR